MGTQKIKIFRILTLLPALFGVLALAGCTQDKDIDGPDGPDTVHGQEVMITVNIPQAQIPSTRSIDGANGEAKVTTIDVLVFNGSTPAVLLEHVKGTNITQSTNSVEQYKVQFLARLSANTNAKTVVLVANAGTETDAAVAAAGGVGIATKPGLLSELTFKSTNSVGTPEGWKWKATNSTNYTPIPMYGEHPLSGGITSGLKIENVELTRMLARIDVQNNATTEFTLSKVHVVNYHTAGYIAPAWNADGTLQTSLPATPMIPGISSQQWDAMEYDYAALNTLNVGNGIYGDIYTYEAAATTGGVGHLDAACLILEGTYAHDGKTYFYRVDFTDKDQSPVAYMPLYRNHLYKVTISAVNGIGYVDIGAALESLSIMNNLKTELLVLDLSDITSTVFNGQYYLGVGSEEVTLSPAIGNATEISCATNYIDGWQIDDSGFTNGIEYITGTGWLKAVKDPLGAMKTADLQFATLSANATGSDREAIVHLKAGRLRHEVKVIQKSVFIRITDISGTPINELVFEGKNSTIGIAPTPQQFIVEWEPATLPVTISSTIVGGANGAFIWQDPSTNALATLPAGGSFTFTIDPKGFVQTEINTYPLMKKESKFTFTLASVGTASIDLKQVHYDALATPEPLYSLLQQNETITVKSNTDWEAHLVTASGYNAVKGTNDDLLSSGTGNGNTGEPLNFTTTMGSSTNGTGISYIKITSPHGKFDPVTLTIKGEWGHIYHVEGSIYLMQPTDGTEVEWASRNTGCPTGYQLPPENHISYIRSQLGYAFANATRNYWVQQDKHIHTTPVAVVNTFGSIELKVIAWSMQSGRTEITRGSQGVRNTTTPIFSAHTGQWYAPTAALKEVIHAGNNWYTAIISTEHSNYNIYSTPWPSPLSYSGLSMTTYNILTNGITNKWTCYGAGEYIVVGAANNYQVGIAYRPNMGVPTDGTGGGCWVCTGNITVTNVNAYRRFVKQVQ